MSDSSFKKYDELIQKIRDHGIAVPHDNQSEDYIREVLSSRSYFGLINAFKKELLNNNQGEEIPFVQFVFMYQIETDLKSLLLKYILLFETRFKEAFSHRLGERYGSDIPDYLDAKNYRQDKRGMVGSEMKYFRYRSGDTSAYSDTDKKPVIIKDNPTKYYRQNKTCIPPWILIRNLSLRETSIWFGLLTTADKAVIANRLLYMEDDTPVDSNIYDALSGALSVITDFRNKLAHGSRIGQYKASTGEITKAVQSSLLSSSCLMDQKGNYHSNDLFTCMCALAQLMSHMDTVSFINELTGIFEKYSDQSEYLSIYKNLCNLPEDFLEELNAFA